MKRIKRGGLFAKKLVIVIISLVLVTITIGLSLIHISEFNKRNDYYAHDFGVNILKTVKPDSILVVTGDTPIFLMWYFQQVEERGRDLR